MRWYFLTLIIVNILLVNIIFNAQLNRHQENTSLTKLSVAFPASIVLISELENLPSEISPPAVNNNVSAKGVTRFEEVEAYSEFDALDDEDIESTINSLFENDDNTVNSSTEYADPDLQGICISLTNLEKDQDMTAIIDMLGRSNIYPEVFNDSLAYYWIFIPPDAITGNVHDNIIAIRNLKMDAHFLNGGIYKGGISTGVFTNENNATRYTDRLRDNGFYAQMEKREQKNFRLVIGNRYLQVFNKEAYEELRRQFNFVKIEEHPC